MNYCPKFLVFSSLKITVSLFRKHFWPRFSYVLKSTIPEESIFVKKILNRFLAHSEELLIAKHSISNMGNTPDNRKIINFKRKTTSPHISP